MNLLFYQEPFPVIELDEEYILREQILEDTEAFFRYYTDPEVGQHILATKPATLLDASKEVQYCRNLFYRKEGIYWTIAKKNNNEMVGAIGLYVNAANHRAEITYDLSHDYWRHGIMQKAIHAITSFAFSKMKLARVEAITRHENIASIALLKKCGFGHEGCLKKYRYFDNQTWDIEMFAITN